MDFFAKDSWTKGYREVHKKGHEFSFDLHFGQVSKRCCYPIDRVFVIEPKIIVISISSI